MQGMSGCAVVLARHPEDYVFGLLCGLFLLVTGAMNIVGSIYFQSVGIHVRLLGGGLSLTWWFRWPVLHFELASDRVRDFANRFIASGYLLVTAPLIVSLWST